MHHWDCPNYVRDVIRSSNSVPMEELGNASMDKHRDIDVRSERLNFLINHTSKDYFCKLHGPNIEVHSTYAHPSL